MRTTMQAEFEHALRLNAHRTAISSTESELTYAELDRWSAAVARQLAANGVHRGSPVALYLRNRPEFVVADIAIARLGAVKVPINYMLATDSVEYILTATRAVALVTDADLAPTVAGFAAGHPETAVLMATGPDTIPGAIALAEAPETGDPEPDFASSGAGADDLAAIYFTGGTTGKPKGVMHTQRSTVALHYAQMLEGEIEQSDRLLLMTPLAHAAGLFAQSAVIRGATIDLRDGFDAAEAVDLIGRGQVTWSFLVPTMIYRILDLLAERPAEKLSMRTIVYGAAPISPVRLEQALRTFGPVFVQLYGQTESPNWGTRLAKSDHDLSRPELLGSCGQASIMADVMVVDDDGKPLPPGQIGEICLRTPYTLLGYLDDEEATAKKFLGDYIHTGDIGEMDSAGYLFLKDRKSDMVITGGMNVYSREVEDVLIGHPDVGTVAVIGIPHDDWGEALHAVVVPTAGSEPDAEQIIAWTRGRIAAYARPKSIEFVAVLPETAFGKVDKKRLRAPYWSGSARGIS